MNYVYGVLVIITLSSLIYIYNTNVQKCVKDVHTFCVMKDSDETKIKVLKEISVRYDKLVSYLEKKHKNDEITKNILKRYSTNSVFKESLGEKYIAYTKNKGSAISFCLKEYDINTLMFVALHELAHIATDEIGHTYKYWENFRFLLRCAEKIKIYKNVDYSKYPVTICDSEIKRNPIYG